MKLVFQTGNLAGSRFEADSEITIGRDASNDVSIPDASVSLVHCQIYTEGDRVFAKDLGSTNGITVNGCRVISSEIRDGDILLIGKSKIRLELPDNRKTIVDVSTADAETDKTTQSAAQLSTIVDGDFLTRAATTVADKHPSGELSGNIFGSVTYYLKRKIADGGMGSVYEAEQFGAEGFIKKVAIKTILPSYVKKESFVSSFIGEAKLVANLVHQNIVQIHHLGRHEDGYYIAMEYIDGINLTKFIRRHRKLKRSVPIEIATFIVSRISRGLEYAHSKLDEDGNPLGLVHRDVSPNNVMITREGEVKLTDFGVAKAAQFMGNDDGYLVGSVEYMSPEQAECVSIDHRSDLYSLGLLLYELLTGVRVFQCEGDDIDGTVARVKASVVPDPMGFRKDLPQAVIEIVMKCLKKRPADRYQTAGELGYALEHEMYSKGYGPTIVTLAGYVNELNKASVTVGL